MIFKNRTWIEVRIFSFLINQLLYICLFVCLSCCYRVFRIWVIVNGKCVLQFKCDLCLSSLVLICIVSIWRDISVFLAREVLHGQHNTRLVFWNCCFKWIFLKWSMNESSCWDIGKTHVSSVQDMMIQVCLLWQYYKSEKEITYARLRLNGLASFSSFFS